MSQSMPDLTPSNDNDSTLLPACFICAGEGEVGIINPQGYTVRMVRCPECGGTGRCDGEEG